MLDIYTLKSCDSCRKAVKWLEARNIKANIYDIRNTGVPAEIIAAAIAELGWEKVLNRRSTTWRNLDDGLKQDVDAVKASALIAQNPTLMKRPLFICGDIYLVGFDNTVQRQLDEITA